MVEATVVRTAAYWQDWSQEEDAGLKLPSRTGGYVWRPLRISAPQPLNMEACGLDLKRPPKIMQAMGRMATQLERHFRLRSPNGQLLR